MTDTIAAVGERGLIDRLRARTGWPPDFVQLGIGDDAAVIEPVRGERVVLTTDSLVEGVHFRRDWSTLSSIGHKAFEVNASDLASMGATPRACLLSLALPESLALKDFDALIDGFIARAHAAGAPLVGGNLTRSPGPIVIDATLVGSVHARRVLTRGGGRAGDELYVTGAVGAAATGLALLDAGANRDSLDAGARECIDRYERPAARLQCGVTVGRRQAANAAMDLSDGLADAVRQIAAASETGAIVHADRIPVHPGAAAFAAQHRRDAIELALSGGEDYELLFAVSRRQKRNFFGALRQCGSPAVTCIGTLEKSPGIWLKDRDERGALTSGYRHFLAT
jgi:thiamine-monophosphate kinase